MILDLTVLYLHTEYLSFLSILLYRLYFQNHRDHLLHFRSSVQTLYYYFHLQLFLPELSLLARLLDIHASNLKFVPLAHIDFATDRKTFLLKNIIYGVRVTRCTHRVRFSCQLRYGCQNPVSKLVKILHTGLVAHCIYKRVRLVCQPKEEYQNYLLATNNIRNLHLD